MPKLPTMGDMGGLTNMAPQGATPKIPSPAPVYDAQMDIGKAVQNLGGTLSAQIQAENKENEAMEVNRATVDYRTKLDELYNSTIDGKKDDYENWSVNFGDAADKVAAEVLKGAKVSDKTRERLSIAFAGYDRPYLARIDGTARRYKEDKVFGDTASNLERSMLPAMKDNATPEEAEEAFRQTDALLKNAEKFLPQRRIEQLRREYLSGYGPKAILYQYGKRESARDVQEGATGQVLRDIDVSLPHARQRYGGQDITGPSPDVLGRFQEFGAKQQPFDPSAPAPSDEQVAAQNKELVDKFNAASKGPAPYSGPMPRIDKLPNGVPFTPTQVPREINQSRPNFERGRMLLGVGEDAKPIEVPYFTGSKTQQNYPGLQYGAFTLLPHRVGENHRYGDTISINPLGSTRQTPIDDPKVGRNRNGQLIHPEQGNPTNIGCISIPDDQWPEVKSAVSEMWKQYGKTNVVLVNAPGQTQIMSRKQYDAMYGGGAPSAPDAGAEPAKRFLVLPGLGGTYGRDKAAFADIARRYGGTAEYLDGDPQVGGQNSPQIARALDRLEKGDYDGIIGYSAGAYNLRHILNSDRFKALPEEKQDRIKHAIAVGLSDEHVGNFKLDARYNPEVFGNLGASHEDAPRALAKKLGTGSSQVTKAADAPSSDDGAFAAVYRAAVAAGSPNPRLTAAIAMHESGFLRSSMAKRANNIFGQTVTDAQVQNGVGGLTGATVGADGQAHGKYASIEDSVRDHLRRWGKYYTDNPQETLQRLVQGGYNVVDRGWGRKVSGIYGRFGEAPADEQPTRVADARMNLGGPKEQDQGQEVAPFDPSSDIEQGTGEMPPAQEAPATTPYEQLTPRQKLFSRMSPEALVRLRNTAQRDLVDAGKTFEAAAVDEALRNGTDYVHPKIGKTYADWANGIRQPQQNAKALRKIEMAKRTFQVYRDMAFIDRSELKTREDQLREMSTPETVADTNKLIDKMYEDYSKVQQIKSADPALAQIGFTLKNPGQGTYTLDELGQIQADRPTDKFAKPHPLMQRALDKIKGLDEDGLFGLSIVTTPDGGVALNTSKVTNPLVKQKAWEAYLDGVWASQIDQGIPEMQRRAITKHMAKTFLNDMPTDEGQLPKYWKQKADQIESMVGPRWAPKVMQDMVHFYLKGNNAADFGGQIKKSEQRGADAAAEQAVGLGEMGTGYVRSRDMERLDRLGRMFGVEQTPGQPLEIGIGGPQPFYEVNPYAGGVPMDPNRPSISPMTRSLQNLTAVSRKQADQVNAKPNAQQIELLRKNPSAWQAFDLKFGRGASFKALNGER